MKIIEKTFNIETGEETIVEREESKAEQAERILLQNAAKERNDAAKLREAARIELLAKLGITAEEAALLLG